jgi:hypothetical protein
VRPPCDNWRRERRERRGWLGLTHLDVDALIETVHLVEQLQQDTLDLAIGTGLGVETLGGNGVHLVHEDDRWRILLGETEHVPVYTE